MRLAALSSGEVQDLIILVRISTPPPRAIEKQVQMQRPGAPVKVLPRHAFEVMGMFFKNPFLLHVLDRVHHR